MTPSRWSLGGVTSGGDLYWAFSIHVHIDLNIIIKFISSRPSGIRGNMQITQLKCRQRFVALSVAIACLKWWYLHPATPAHSVLCLSVATWSSKGIPSESHSKICHSLFSVWLTSSIMCRRTFTNLFLNVKSLTMMRLIMKRGERLVTVIPFSPV